MREILFRGKSVETGDWFYGSFCRDATEQIYGVGNFMADGFIRYYDASINMILMEEVERETVGQYTGLADKNGKPKQGKVVERECAYYADFVYYENGERIVEDVKGVRTEAYKIKRKLMRWIHGIEIREV